MGGHDEGIAQPLLCVCADGRGGGERRRREIEGICQKRQNDDDGTDGRKSTLFCLAAARSRKFDFAAAERQLRVWLSHSEGRAGIGSYLVKGLWGVWGFISTLWKTAAVYRYAKQVLNWGKAVAAS